jgi:hypothetical protein
LENYDKARKYLLEKYPRSQEEARMLGQPWGKEPEEPYQINIAKAQDYLRYRIIKESELARFLNFIAELYFSQTKLPFYILTNNPQIVK